MATQLVAIQHFIGVVLVFSGLFPIYTQLALQVGWIVKKEKSELGAGPGVEGLQQVPESAIKLLDKLLDNAGWMVVIGLILIYFGLRCLGVGLFGS